MPNPDGTPANAAEVAAADQRMMLARRIVADLVDHARTERAAGKDSIGLYVAVGMRTATVTAEHALSGNPGDLASCAIGLLTQAVLQLSTPEST